MSRLAAIIPAAGLSSRMGHFKPLLMLGGETVIDRVTALFSDCNIDVYLVTGWRSDEVAAGIKNRNIRIIKNPDYQQGMFTSIRAGLAALSEGYEAFFMMPVDIPLVRPVTIRLLSEAAYRHPGSIIHPAFENKRGHPPLVPAVLRNQIMEWRREGGLKTFFRTQEDRTIEIAVPDANIHLDMDHYSDFETITERFRYYEIPSEKECDVITNDVYPMEDHRKRHSQKVAEISMLVAKRLVEAGNRVDLELVRAGAILHDIAKGSPQHETVGGRILREMGFGKTGDVVAAHTRLSGNFENYSIEARIVYLADKMVIGDRIATIEERYNVALARFGFSDEVKARIEEGRLQARRVKQELEGLAGCPLEKMLESPS